MLLFTKIPNVQTDILKVREIAPSGFVVALDVRWKGPEYLHSEFPEKWKELYEDNGYFMMDPIFYWTLMNTGVTRWSEVDYPDPRGIGTKAAEHGLVFGATVSVKVDGMRSFLSAARADRELTEEEITSLANILEKWANIVKERPNLSDNELETLACLRSGLDQTKIAKKLGVSISTVKKRLSKVRRAFEASSNSEALSIAIEKRYFDKR